MWGNTVWKCCCLFCNACPARSPPLFPCAWGRRSPPCCGLPGPCWPNCSPVGIFFSAIFFGILKMGRGSLAATGIPTEIADTIIATIIYFTATNVILASFWNRIFHSRFAKKEEAAAAAMRKKGDSTTISSLTEAHFNEYAKEGRALLKNAKEGR